MKTTKKGRRPKIKMTKNEDDKKLRRQKTKTTKYKDDKNKDNQKRRQPKTKTTKNEYDQKQRRPKTKLTKNEDDQKQSNLFSKHFLKMPQSRHTSALLYFCWSSSFLVIFIVGRLHFWSA